MAKVKSKQEEDKQEESKPVETVELDPERFTR